MANCMKKQGLVLFKGFIQVADPKVRVTSVIRLRSVPLCMG